MAAVPVRSFPETLLALDGEAGRLIVGHAWSRTSLGPIDGWPACLKTVLGLILMSPLPMVMLWGEDGVMLHNDAYSAFAGEGQPELMGSKVREGWPAVSDFGDKVMKIGLAGGKLSCHDQELTLFRNGRREQVWININGSPVPGEDGRPAGVVAIIVETTERVLMERRQEFLFDLEKQLRAQADGKATRLDTDYRFTRGDGSLVWMAASAQDDGQLSDGHPARIVGVSHEVTARKRAEEALRASEEMSRRVLASSSDCIEVLSLDGRREAMSEGGQQALEIDHIEPFVGQVWAEGFERESRAAAHAAVAAASLGQMSRFEAALRTQRGEPRWWDTVVSAISGPDGRPEKLLALSRDVSERRTSEQALRESETRYRTLFEAIEAGFCVVEVIFSSDGRPVDHLIVEANPAFEHQTGLSNVVGRRASELAPGTEQNWNDLYGRVALSGKPERIEGANAALGRWFDVHVSRAAAPRQHRVAVLFNDITLRKAAEKELRESETRRGAALSIAKLGTFEWDCVTGRVTLDERGRQIFGLWGDEGVTAAQIFDRMHPDDVSRVRDEARDATAAGRHIEIAYRIVLPDGETRTVSSHGEPIGGDDDGEQMRMVGVFRDVTEQARAQAALEESEARLRELNETLEAQVELRTAELRLARDIIEANASPICAFDTEYRLIAFNRAHSDEFFCIFAHRVAVGEVFPDLFPPDQAPTMRSFMARALAGESYTVVEEFGDPDLAKPYWEVSYTPLRDAQGRVVGAFHLASDITARLRAQDELSKAQDALRQSQKMEAMGQLTGGVAHDFNNLLTPIVGSLDMLQRRGLGNEREQRLIGGAMQSAERAKTLVQRLLAFARRQPLQAVSVDLKALVHGMAGLIGSTLGPRIDIQVDLADDLPLAKADPNQLEMAMLNLSVNARDAMPDGGTLKISAARESVGRGQKAALAQGHYVRLSVSDTGTGMSDATLARAVEPFFSTKGVGKGTGLGLSMVHGLAAQLGGGLTIMSEPGAGTTIDLWLPLGDGPSVSGDVATTASEKRSRGQAILVDDEELVRMSTADMLEDLGYEVIEASSAEEALQLLSAGTRADVLVTDHLMPGMSGSDLAREVRRMKPGLPILIVSGYAEVDGIAPDLPRLTKPFRNAELAERLADLRVGHASG
jgi:PAS domain S-box-containing protein